jgi:L-lactate dehydrogenase complex protein LldF
LNPSAPQPLDRFAAALAPGRRDAVLGSAAATHEARRAVLETDYGAARADALRRLAGQVKQHTLENLDRYLAQAETALAGNGATVHFARGADAACRTVREILDSRGARKVVKSKSMATEEIGLNGFLEASGVEVVETDLGEFIVQIEGDHPSHIVRPVIHMDRREIARAFQRERVADTYSEDPATITLQARAHLRAKFLGSDAAVTGANFLSAESGRLAIVTNEGNARFATAANRLHIAVVGIEKLVPRDRDLALFLNLLARSATGQHLTVYTHFVSGPRATPPGPARAELHVVLLDNGRSSILGSGCSEILRCIRCGACQNVCPVYRQASGHAYRSVYGGPVGAVLTPLLDAAGGRFADHADLPKASSLCGACQEVCPVDIPIPDMLLKLRHRSRSEGTGGGAAIPATPFRVLATSPRLWRAALAISRSANLAPGALALAGPLRSWLAVRTLPRWRGGEFRRWLADHRRERGGAENCQEDIPSA